jgi:hypothetical protein
MIEPSIFFRAALQMPLIADMRQVLWRHGYRPVPINNGEKFPLERAWPDLARRNPPRACTIVRPWQLGTGILSDGLRAVDNDIKDVRLASTFNGWLYDRFGYAPFRHRGNSHSRLMLFRAAEGKPRKASCKNKTTGDGVEILGRGNQFFSYGVHPSGATLLWLDGPLETPRDQLPVLTDEQCREIIEYAAQLIGADRKAFHTFDEPMPIRNATGEEWCIGDIKVALAVIPNVGTDWEFWFRVAAAVFNASNGSQEGFDAFVDWSCKARPRSNSADRLWRSLHSCPANEITAGSLTWYARQHDPDWERPSSHGFSRLRLFQ